MKTYHDPSEVEVIRNRNTKKITITTLYGNPLFHYKGNFIRLRHKDLLKLIPCRTELRFNKLYNYALLHQVI